MPDKPSEYLEAGLNITLGEDIKHLIDSTAVEKLVPKATVILRQGEPFSALYYIHHGIMRGYYIDGEGNDVTKCFSSETEFACSEGLRKAGEASFSIESLEDCTCIVIPYSTIYEGLKKSNEIIGIINEYSKKIILQMEKRSKGLLMKNALDRYIEFRNDYSYLEDRISQAHIASYIGIRASSLSRIKRSITFE